MVKAVSTATKAATNLRAMVLRLISVFNFKSFQITLSIDYFYVNLS